MIPKILPAAVADLEWGREFYDNREPGIGDYFLQRAFAEIGGLLQTSNHCVYMAEFIERDLASLGYW
jgi:hypothetical protein